MHIKKATAVLQALAAALARSDAEHRAAARQRLQERRRFEPPADAPPELADALAGLARAWDRVVLSEHDAAWARTLLPLERTGSADARRVLARATDADRDAMCVGPGRRASDALREFRLRHPPQAVVGRGPRTWSGRHSGSSAYPDTWGVYRPPGSDGG